MRRWIQWCCCFNNAPRVHSYASGALNLWTLFWQWTFGCVCVWGKWKNNDFHSLMNIIISVKDYERNTAATCKTAHTERERETVRLKYLTALSRNLMINSKNILSAESLPNNNISKYWIIPKWIAYGNGSWFDFIMRTKVNSIYRHQYEMYNYRD